jgi:fermentation-respiration switch protein FrsA (DUF1100 family)
MMGRKRMFNILIGVALLYAVALGMLFFFQRSFLYFPEIAYLSPAHSQANAKLQELAVKTEDGLDLKGWYAPASGKPLTLVFFHGNADNLRSVAPMADPYIAAGYGFLIAEYRGYSAMPGKPTEQGLYKDARAYVKALLASGLKEENLILFGHSLGTGVATQMATEFKAAGLILLSPYLSIAKMAQVRFPLFPADLMMEDRYESWKRMSSIHMPLLLAHGESDIVVPTSQGKELFTLAKEPKQLKLFPGGGHSNLYDFGFGETSLAWLDDLAKKR